MRVVPLWKPTAFARAVVLASVGAWVCAGAPGAERPAHAQAPPVTASCVSNCGSSGRVSDSRQRLLDHNHAVHAKEERWFNAAAAKWKRAADDAKHHLKTGQDALAKGHCQLAFTEFEQEISGFGVDLSLPGNLVDSVLYGRWYGMVVQQRLAIQAAQTRLANARASCIEQASAQRAPSQSATRATSAPSRVTAPLVRIGAAAAVQGEVYWLTNDGERRPIHSGDTIYFNSRIVTGRNGHFQVLLLDETVFTLGPTSDLVLDEFVYDPNTSVGKAGAALVKGTFRWVTGKMGQFQHKDLKLKLAVGDLGIRGTDFEVQYAPGVAGYIRLAKGELLVTPNIGTPFTMHAGEAASIEADGSLLPPNTTLTAAPARDFSRSVSASIWEGLIVTSKGSLRKKVQFNTDAHPYVQTSGVVFDRMERPGSSWTQSGANVQFTDGRDHFNGTVVGNHMEGTFTSPEASGTFVFVQRPGRAGD